MTAPPPSEYERRRRTSEGHVEQESGYDGPEEYKQDSDRRVAGHGLCVGRTNQISENDQNAHPYVGDRPVHVSSSTLKHPARRYRQRACHRPKSGNRPNDGYKLQDTE